MANSFRATPKRKAEKVKVLSESIQKIDDELKKKNEITQINNSDSHEQI